MQTAVELNLAYQNLDQYFTGWYELKVSRKKMFKDTRLHRILHNCLSCHEIGSFVSYMVMMFFLHSDNCQMTFCQNDW